MSRNEDIRVLMDLGLSLVQATVYLNLVKVGEANAKTVAKLSGIARQDIYEAMQTLEERRLVKKIVANPTVYRATPLKKALAFLIEDKKIQLERLDEEKELLINNLSVAQTSVDVEEAVQFVLASELCLFLKTHEVLLQETQTSIDIVMPVQRVPGKVNNEWELLREKLQSNSNLRIRLIANKPSDSNDLVWQPLVGHPSFQIKYTDEPILFGMHIFDNKQVTLQVKKGSIMPSLWSNNPNIVEFAITFFKSKWEKEG